MIINFFLICTFSKLFIGLDLCILKIFNYLPDTILICMVKSYELYNCKNCIKIFYSIWDRMILSLKNLNVPNYIRKFYFGTLLLIIWLKIAYSADGSIWLRHLPFISMLMQLASYKFQNLLFKKTSWNIKLCSYLLLCDSNVLCYAKFEWFLWLWHYST